MYDRNSWIYQFPGPAIGKVFSGNKELAESYLGLGMSMLLYVKTTMRNGLLGALSINRTLPDGTAIRIDSFFGQDRIMIDAPLGKTLVAIEINEELLFDYWWPQNAAEKLEEFRWPKLDPNDSNKALWVEPYDQKIYDAFKQLPRTVHLPSPMCPPWLPPCKFKGNNIISTFIQFDDGFNLSFIPDAIADWDEYIEDVSLIVQNGTVLDDSIFSAPRVSSDITTGTYPNITETVRSDNTGSHTCLTQADTIFNVNFNDSGGNNSKKILEVPSGYSFLQEADWDVHSLHIQVDQVLSPSNPYHYHGTIDNTDSSFQHLKTTIKDYPFRNVQAIGNQKAVYIQKVVKENIEEITTTFTGEEHVWRDYTYSDPGPGVGAGEDVKPQTLTYKRTKKDYYDLILKYGDHEVETLSAATDESADLKEEDLSTGNSGTGAYSTHNVATGKWNNVIDNVNFSIMGFVGIGDDEFCLIYTRERHTLTQKGEEVFELINTNNTYSDTHPYSHPPTNNEWWIDMFRDIGSQRTSCPPVALPMTWNEEYTVFVYFWVNSREFKFDISREGYFLSNVDALIMTDNHIFYMVTYVTPITGAIPEPPRTYKRSFGVVGRSGSPLGEGFHYQTDPVETEESHLYDVDLKVYSYPK